MTNNIEPKEGHRYRVSFEFTAEQITRGNNGACVVRSTEGQTFLGSLGEWEEIEPEYVQDGLYIDSVGQIYRRSPVVSETGIIYPWRTLYGGGRIEESPKRPLERLFRESEIPK